MEGVLWKWTNYFSGWQSRWFVLDNGILSYYKSQEDVVNGCKGSVAVAVCDVYVHPTDATRLDLSIPGEAHFYVKAATPQERQEWLIALGSCKAGVQPSATAAQTQPLVDIPDDELKSKKSELRLYCDLLMQQVVYRLASIARYIRRRAMLKNVHSVKSSVTDSNRPDLPKMNEATTLLSATCDTFIKTLDECMQLVNSMPAGQHSPAIREGPPTPTRRLSKSSYPQGVQRQTSQDSHIPAIAKTRTSYASSISNSSRHSSDSTEISPSHSQKAMALIQESATTNQNEASGDNQSEASLFRRDTSPSSKSSDAATASGKRPLQREGSARGTSAHGEGAVSLDTTGAVSADNGNEFMDATDTKVATFFSAMEISFSDVKLLDDGGVPTEPFLNACQQILPIFDKLNPTAFAPIKMEFTGNVKKIHHKYSRDREHFASLQNIILYEIRKEHHVHANSATNSLLWLKRGLTFIREFLLEFMTGMNDLQLASVNAYSRSLKPYHSYVVRGVFALAAKSAPNRQAFLRSLAGDPSHVIDAQYEQILLRQIEDYVTHSDRVLKVISDFYSVKQLEVKVEEEN